MDLLLSIESFQVRGAFREEGGVFAPFALSLETSALKEVIGDKKIEKAFLCAEPSPFEKELFAFLTSQNIPVKAIEIPSFYQSVPLSKQGIAGIYGALTHFPLNDCIIIEIGKAIRFDYIEKEGTYKGSSVYPEFDCQMALLSSRFPLSRPKTSISTTLEEQMHSGLYWAVLGTIERLLSEMRQNTPSPSSVKVIATGELLSCFNLNEFSQDVSDFTDLVDPALALLGLHELLKNKKEN